MKEIGKNKRINIDMVHVIKCEGKSDAELVRLTLENPDYFLCLMKNYEDKIIRYIRRISGVRHEDAEDVCQEVFIKVFKNLNAFDDSLKFSSWIYRIAHNHVISEFRKYKNRKEQILSEEEDWQHFVSQIDVEKEVDSVVNREIINKVLAELDIKYREVLVLNFLLKLLL